MNIGKDVSKSTLKSEEYHKTVDEISHLLIDDYEPDPLEVRRFTELAADPRLYKRRIDAVGEQGIVGERFSIAMYLATMDSRLVKQKRALALKSSGPAGAGKSTVLGACMELFPEYAYIFLTSASPKSLNYLTGGLKHKCIVMNEAIALGSSKDSDLAYAIRSLISEGELRHFVAERDGDSVVTVEKKQEGPISFITTTNLDFLEEQLEDRMFTIHPDDSGRQTLRIMEELARTSMGLVPKEKDELDKWNAFHKSLKPEDVIIPFADKIVTASLSSTFLFPLGSRRAFERLLTVIKSVAVFYSHQRERDTQMRIIAEIADYYMAKQIVARAYRENVLGESDITRRRLQLFDNGANLSLFVLAKAEGLSKQGASNWAKKQVDKGRLQWVNEHGKPFITEQAQNRAKRIGMAYLKATDQRLQGGLPALPEPFELTDEPSWQPGGTLLTLYWLDLEEQRTPPKSKGKKSWNSVAPEIARPAYSLKRFKSLAQKKRDDEEEYGKWDD